jgi:hypothetical protein
MGASRFHLMMMGLMTQEIIGRTVLGTGIKMQENGANVAIVILEQCQEMTSLKNMVGIVMPVNAIHP